jgi:hypothetical protein
MAFLFRQEHAKQAAALLKRSILPARLKMNAVQVLPARQGHAWEKNSMQISIPGFQ